MVSEYNKPFDSPGCAVWEFTLGCDLKCMHCGSSAGKVRPNELSTKEALNLVKDLAEIGTNEVCLMGGEPLLRKDWFEVAKEIKNNNMEFSIISNGFNVTEKTIEKFRQLEPHVVSTSLDGGSAEVHDKIRGVNGSFDRVMNYVDLARKSDLPTSVITTVSKLNFKDLPKIKDLLFDRFIAWQIQTASPIGRFPKDLVLTEEEFYSLGLFIASLKTKFTSRQIPVIGAHGIGYYSCKIPNITTYPEWRGCQAGMSVISIMSDGGVKGCLSTPDEYIEDNIRNRNIKDIWNDPNSFAYNRCFKVEELGKNCKDCEHGIKCKGGCMSVSTSNTGKAHNSPYCFYRYEKQINL